MRRRPPRPAAVVVVALASAGVIVASTARPGYEGLAVEAYVLFLGALGLAALAKVTSKTFEPAGASRVLAPKPRPRTDTRPSGLVRLERELEMATQSAFDAHFRLRPTLREVASARLALHGVDLDAPGGRAEALLGPDAWALVRPDALRPSDHYAPGVALADVARALDAVESLP
jgi:hypothetical protein